jgi:SagB-type dehydrogenase family enzyme
MRQMDIDYAVIAALFLSGLYVATTGILMGLLGSPQFVWHSYAGYASAVLAGLHLILNWPRLTGYLRHRLKGTGRKSTTPAQPTYRLSRRVVLAAVPAAMAGCLLGWLISRPRPAGLPVEATDVDQFYHQWSKPDNLLSLGTLLSWGSQPARYKRYPAAQQVSLPDPHGYRGLSLEEAIEQRRSRRNYTSEPLSLVELARLLHAASGLTDPNGGYRAAPSAGALYPIEIYAIVHNITGLQPGLYHYNVAEHALEKLRLGDLRTEITVAGIGQELLGQAGVCLALSAIFQRSRWKYRERAYRYVLLEAGHIGQNLYLAATSMGLGACAVGAFLDDRLNELVGLDGEEETALYLIAVGKL